MKVCLLGDIHANFEALKAVLEYADAQRIKHYVCLGDIVGYGGSPLECIHEIQALECPVVAGNHDFAVVGYTSDDYFNPYAKDAVAWTRNQLGPEETEFLTSLPYVHHDLNDFTVVHSTLDEPEKWGYVLNFFDAEKCFKYLKSKVCFIGHSHIPLIIEKGPTTEAIYEAHYKLYPDCRYIINIGSVGQPRDGNNKACFAIFDTEELEIEIIRLDYDIAKAQAKIVDSGLPEVLADRLGVGK